MLAIAASTLGGALDNEFMIIGLVLVVVLGVGYLWYRSRRERQG